MNNTITITGDIGSGKSDVSKLLQNMLGYEAYSTGAEQREMAHLLGMSTLEMNEYAMTNPEVDYLLNSSLVRFANGHKGSTDLDWYK